MRIFDAIDADDNDADDDINDDDINDDDNDKDPGNLSKNFTTVSSVDLYQFSYDSSDWLPSNCNAQKTNVDEGTVVLDDMQVLPPFSEQSNKDGSNNTLNG